MKKLSQVALLVLFSSSLMAQDHVIHLYGEALNPGHEETVTLRGIDWVTDIQNPILEVFLPAPKQSTGQAVMICPGGGYSGLAYDWEGLDVAKWLNGNGIAGIVLKYRMPDATAGLAGTLIPINDAKKGLEIIHAHAEEWNIDKDKIGILGFSAGGSLASLTSTLPPTLSESSADTINPDFSILIYPVISMKSITHGGSKLKLIGENPTAEQIKEFSSEERVNEHTPPTLLIHSADDKGVPVENSLVYYQALKDHDIPVEMHLYNTGGHGYALAINGGQESQWPALCIQWLKSLNKEK